MPRRRRFLYNHGAVCPRCHRIVVGHVVFPFSMPLSFLRLCCFLSHKKFRFSTLQSQSSDPAWRMRRGTKLHHFLYIDYQKMLVVVVFGANCSVHVLIRTKRVGIGLLCFGLNIEGRSASTNGIRAATLVKKLFSDTLDHIMLDVFAHVIRIRTLNYNWGIFKRCVICCLNRVSIWGTFRVRDLD